MFPYALGDLRFTERLEFPKGGALNAAESDAFLKLLDLSAVVLGVSYFKLLAPTRIVADLALTEREREVLRLLAKGWDNHRIAKELGISERTVRFHLRNIYDKIGAQTRSEAVVWAVHQGLDKG